MESRFNAAIYRLFALLAIAALTVTVYWPGLNGPFLFDDNIHIRKNEQVHITDLSPASLHQAWNSSLTPGRWHRELAQLSFGINHAVSGLSTFGFKATNLAIHLLNGLLIYLLSRLLLRAVTGSRGETVADSRHEWFALAVTAMWLLHPLNLTTVLYVVQRMTQLSTLFMLLGLALYVSGRLQMARRNGGMASVLLAFPVAAFGLLAKENAALFPVLLGTLELTLLRGLDRGKSRRALQAVWLLGIALPIVLGAIYLLTHPGIINYATRPFSMEERLLTQARVLWLYLQLMLIPSTQSLGFMHDDFPLSHGLTDPISTLPAVLSWPLLLLAALLFARRFPLPAFTVLFFLGAHALESSLFPLELVFEHRNYLALLAPLFALCYLLLIHFRDSPGGRLIWPLLIPLCLLFAVTTHLRASDWRNLPAFILSEVEHHPDSPRNNFKAAQLYIDLLAKIDDRELAYNAAARHFHKILELQPGHPNSLFGLIVLNLHAGKPPDPAWVAQLEHELRYGDVGPTRLSVSQFSFLVRWQKQSHFTLEHEVVLRLFEAAIDNPGMNRIGRASLYSTRRAYYQIVLEQPELAIQDARQAAKLWPARWHFQKRLAELAMQLSRFDESEQTLRKALDRGLPENQRIEAQQLLRKLESARKDARK